MTTTIATWNINSVRLRASLVVKLLKEEAPDVLCLQECKSPVDKVPMDLFGLAGYSHVIARGQKGYNGVAILSRRPITEVAAEDFADLGHARHIAGQLENGLTIHNFYVPAGGDVPDREVNEKFGSEEDLKSLVESAHKMDILVMVDVVANHIGYVPTDKKTKIEDFSGVWPFHDESYYHDNCQITDWENQWQLENCRLCGLPDLK